MTDSQGVRADGLAATESAGSPRAWLLDGLWVVALVGGMGVVWWLHVVRTATTLFPMGAGDSYGYFLPAYAYQARRMEAGGFPFWNPYQGAGVPFLATLQAGALYPARLLLLVTSPPRAMGASVFGHVVLALVGTYALCRRLGASAAGAAIGALVFTTTFALPAFPQATLLEPGAWLPTVALATVAVVQGGGWAWVLGLGLALAMPPLAGGYQMMLYTIYGAALFGLAAALDRRGPAPGARVLWRLAVAGLLAVATAAPQLLATIAWSENTVRQTKPLTDLQMMPFFTEQSRWLRVRAFFVRSSPTAPAYFSIPVLALFAVGLLRARRLGIVLGIGALATALLATVPADSALFGIYKALPGFAMFRFPGRLLLLTSLLVAVLAALGLSSLTRLPALAPARRRAALDVVALATVVALLVWPFRNHYVMPWDDASPLARPDPSFFPGTTRPSAADRVSVPGESFTLRMGAFPRQGTLQGVRVLQDYEPLSSRRLGDFLSAVWGLPPLREEDFPPFTGAIRGAEWMARPRLLDLVAVRGIVTTDAALPLAGVPGWTRVGGFAEFATYRNDRALPRAYVVERARFTPDEHGALFTIRQHDFDPRAEAVLVGSDATSEETRAIAAGPATPLVPARIVVDDPERIVIDVAPARPSLLVLADAFAPGWEAAVDGRWRRVWQTNHLVRGVLIGPGDRRIELRYHAPGFALGITFLAVTWTLVLGALVLARARRRLDTR